MKEERKNRGGGEGAEGCDHIPCAQGCDFCLTSPLLVQQPLSCFRVFLFQVPCSFLRGCDLGQRDVFGFQSIVPSSFQQLLLLCSSQRQCTQKQVGWLKGGATTYLCQRLQGRQQVANLVQRFVTRVSQHGRVIISFT